MTEEYFSLVIKRYRDNDGNPTCAMSFDTGAVCVFLGTAKFGLCDVCTYQNHAGADLERRDLPEAHGVGSLIPTEQCPLWTAKSDKKVAEVRNCDDGYPGCRHAEATGEWCKGECCSAMQNTYEEETTADVQDERPMPPEGHPLRTLGQRLAHYLDDDKFNECERLLLDVWEELSGWKKAAEANIEENVRLRADMDEMTLNA